MKFTLCQINFLLLNAEKLYRNNLYENYVTWQG